MGFVLSVKWVVGKYGSSGGVLDVVAGMADILSEAAHRTATRCEQGEENRGEGEKGET